MPTATGERSAVDDALALAPVVQVDEGDGSDPSITSAAYGRMKPRWEKCRDCFVGTEAIRAGGTKYLPQYSAESIARYEVRRKIAAFYNGYGRTVVASVGMLVEEEPALGDDMPQELKDLWENIDAAGTHGAVFTRRLATSGIVDGYAGILVEHSRVTDPLLDLAKASADAALAIAEGRPLAADDEKALGLRPYFLLFKADDVLFPIYEKINGVKTLVQIVFREVVTRRKGQFGVRSVTQYRVYVNTRGVVTYELWRTPDAGGKAQRVEGPTVIPNQTSIPWSPFPAGDEVAPGEWKPPLLDLADLNIQYHVSLTNHLSLQSLAYVPTPVRIGAQADENGDYPELVLGPGNTIEAPIVEGVAQPIYWLSPPVDVLEFGESTLQSTKADMGTLGAAFLSAETRAAETAEGKRIDSAASRATLKSVSRALKDCLETAFGFVANYRRTKAGSVTLSEDFTGEGIDPQMMAGMTTAYQAGGITLQEYRHFLRTGQLPEDFDPADVLALVDAIRKRSDTNPFGDRAELDPAA